jgi:predicted nuclease with TOPRIM domain
MEQAQNHLAEYKRTVESECETALQVQRDAEKAVTDIKQKMVELSATLEQEIVNKQKLTTELAVISERLIKQDEAFVIQKNQYEERLKRVYDEKDRLEIQYQQLHNEAKALQEKFSLQTQQHQNSLNQQNTLHEQSENRWLKIIDQTKQEVKDTQNKYGIVISQSDEKIKKLNTALADFQQNYFEKTAQLNTAQDRIIQIKQEATFLEEEYIKARATIIKLEEELINTHALVKNKYKNEKEIKSKTDISS